MPRPGVEAASRISARLFPHGRPHQPDADRILRAEDLGLTGARARQHSGDQGDVAHVARKHAHVIQRLREDVHAGGGDGSEGRLESEDAAVGGRPDNRAGCLGADGERHHAIGDGGRRAARRAPRRAFQIQGVGGRSGRREGQLGGDRLAENDRARLAQHGHRRRVLARPPAPVERAAALGGHVGGVEDVLDADGHAVQRPEPGARIARGVGIAGGGERKLRIHEGPRAHQGVSTLDAFEARFHQRQRSDFPAGDRRRRAAGGELVERQVRLHFGRN